MNLLNDCDLSLCKITIKRIELKSLLEQYGGVMGMAQLNKQFEIDNYENLIDANIE